MFKLISIVIATYNAEKTIKRCLDSIISQKTSQIELVIIDGASTDGTVGIIQSYGALVDIFISEEDAGVYDAWNKALKLVTGKWIMFLGADDYWLSNSGCLYLNYLNSSNDIDDVDIISAQSRLVDENGTFQRVLGNPYQISEFRRYMKISHGSTLHNRKLFDELGGFNTKFKICSDYDFLLRRALNSRYIAIPTIVMQIGGMSDTLKGLWESFQVKFFQKSIPLYLNLYYLAKGITGYYTRKCICLLRKK